MAYEGRPNVSDTLIWGVIRSQNAYLVKQSHSGGPQFSRDPLNLANLNSRKYSGLASDKAIGIQAGENGAITITTKSPKNPNKTSSDTYSTSATNRKIYKGVANRAVKNGYRADLRATAVHRASALRLAQRPKKDLPVKALRGVKARKAEAEA
ncbi:hypothetical protein AJ80_06444 [Polytolypa hystricis UAMH7299]|uniref:Ribosomal eL28/Mak16 domain-containing protein n=1 Tax=Polytolypa hystricis (strain UAMH7299) TaxID=1447883 RepID=A0A2B7XXA4_POLH7|nr:hypothetical protein AJ80_06444 [Polytolypa hystricis UAMH7299]